MKLTPIRARTVAICHVKAMSRTNVFHPNRPLYNTLICLHGHSITNPLLSVIPIHNIVSSHQGERISDSDSTLMEEFHHVKRQTIYSSSSTLPEKEPGKPNRILDKVLTSKWDIESSYRAGEVHEVGRISGINSTLVEESHRVEMQTTDGINILSMQEKEESGEPDNITKKSITSGKDVISSHQGERGSGSDSTLMEESHQVKRQTIYSSSSMHLEKKPGKPNRDLNIVLISEKDVESSHQVGRISDEDSTLMEESHQVKKQTTCSSNVSITHPEEETSRPDRKPGKTTNSEKDGEGSHQAGRVSGIISTLMEESHHVKMQITHNSGHPSLHPEEYDILNIDLGKIHKPEKDGEGSQQNKRISGINSNLVEGLHQVRKQTTYRNDNQSIHLEKEIKQVVHRSE